MPASYNKYLIGVGNSLMGDDAIGLMVAEYIENNIHTKDFEVLKLSHNSLEILDYFTQHTQKIVIVDCAKMNATPGDYKIFEINDVKSQKNFDPISTHGFDILKIINLANYSQEYHIPPITIIGIEPQTTEFSMQLSEVLQNKFMEYVQIALEQIKSSML